MSNTYPQVESRNPAISIMLSNVPAVDGSGNPVIGVPLNAASVANVSPYLAANPAEWTRLRNKWSAAITALQKRHKGFSSFDPGYNLALEGTALLPNERRIQMMVLFRLNVPSAGMVMFNPDLLIRIKGLDGLSISNAYNIGASGGTGPLFQLPANCSDWYYKTKEPWNPPYYNPMDFVVLIGGLFANTGLRPPWYATNLSNCQPANNANPSRPYFPFVSKGFTVNASMTFSGGNLTFELYQGKNVYDPKNNELGVQYKDAGAPALSSVLGSAECLHQAAQFKFAPESAIAMPTLDTNLSSSIYNMYKIESRLFPTTTGTCVLSSSDTIRSMCFNTDGRLAAVMSNIADSSFVAYPAGLHQFNYLVAGYTAYSLDGAGGQTARSWMIPPGTAITTGDFDICMRAGPGGFINKPDEGDNSPGTLDMPPYFWYGQDCINTTLYTPNRIMPSPGMFGSLPTGAKAGVGWKTLLFRPQPSHPSYSTTIPDHLIMDLFWMPVVEPYALSETFSTTGKVNMNYQILPFTYINRSTALRAAMKVEMGAAVPNGAGINFSSAPGIGDPITGGTTWRKNLNLSDTDGTLRQFKAKFAAGDIFRSASQICDIYLVPRDQSWASDSAAQNFWKNNLNTPENLREKPYANLYARLTTKSNTFTIHCRVQVLKKLPGSQANQWVEGQDKIIAEQRLSTVVERYLDASGSNFPDFAADTSKPISDFYHMRFLSTKHFAP